MGGGPSGRVWCKVGVCEQGEAQPEMSESMTKMAQLSSALVAWFRVHQRDLPWRRDPAPYRVWISEIMLQQTQVVTVVPYFERWMAAFPRVEALAAAPIEEVLAQWSGLGYYRRAHLLHRAAGEVVEAHGGALPEDLKGLLGLPGIGRYTAGAIASIAHNVPAPIVDGNVIRVLSRIFAVEGDPRARPASERLWSLAEALIPEGQARDFNQSLMELGALVCTPRKPRCGECPASAWCEALATDRVEVLPQPPRRQKKRPMFTAIALLRDPDTGHYLLLQRPTEGLFGGLFECPTLEIEAPPTGVTEGLGAVREALEAYLAALGVEASIGASLGRVSHTLTHIQLTIQPFRAELRALRKPLPETARWVAPKALDVQPLSNAFRKVLAVAFSDDAQGSLF